MSKLRTEIVKTLKAYPGITSNMDLTINSPLVIDIANTVKGVVMEELNRCDNGDITRPRTPFGDDVILTVGYAEMRRRIEEV